MKEINKVLYKTLEPSTIPAELDYIASRHRCCGNQVERGPFGIVKVIFPSGEAHYYPSKRGIELCILKYDAQELKERKPSIHNIKNIEVKHGSEVQR